MFFSSHNQPIGLARTLLCLFLALESGAVSGCALFEKPLKITSNETRRLPSIRLPPDAVQLDVVFVERPLGDPLLGTELWRHIDQVASLDAPTRAAMRESGFRAGVVASRPPVALQQVLGLKSDFAYEPDAERMKQLAGHHVMIRSGGETDIQISPYYEECTFDVLRNGQSRALTVGNARCLFKLKAEKLQEGWAQLEFVPQVQYGEERLRHVADSDGWRYQNSQKTETLHARRFALKLSIGEMAVVTAADQRDGTLGQLFFCGPAGMEIPVSESDSPDHPRPYSTADGPTVQRMLVVRLSGMGDSASGPTRQ